MLFLVHDFKNIKHVTLQSQSEQAEKKIKQEFERLHQILKEEENARIVALKKEEDQKKRMLTEKIDSISRDITSLTELIQSIRKEMSAHDLVVLQVWNLSLFLEIVWKWN